MRLPSWLRQFAQRWVPAFDGRFRREASSTRRRVRPTLEVLEDRTVPTDIAYHGGPTIPHVQVNNIVMGSQPVDPNALMQALVRDYLPMLGPNYGIGAGILRSSINLPPFAGNPSDAQIRMFLVQEINSGALPPPDGNQLYVIFLAPGQMDSEDVGSDAGGYHSWQPDFINGSFTPIYYAVIYGLGSQPISVLASHELAESVTDPDDATGYIDLSQNGGATGEVADIYESQMLTFPLDGFSVAVLSGPQGQKIAIFPPATPQNLIVLAVEEAETLALKYLSMSDPLLTPYAQLANGVLNQNLLYGTPQGQIGVLLGESVFSSWVSQQNGG